MRIYISGPISGTAGYKERFRQARTEIDEKAWWGEIETSMFDLTIINPVELCEQIDGTWADYMDVCLAALRLCDAIYILRGWEKSKGATIEKLYAEGAGLKIFYQ